MVRRCVTSNACHRHALAVLDGAQALWLGHLALQHRHVLVLVRHHHPELLVTPRRTIILVYLISLKTSAPYLLLPQLATSTEAAQLGPRPRQICLHMSATYAHDPL